MRFVEPEFFILKPKILTLVISDFQLMVPGKSFGKIFKKIVDVFQLAISIC